MHNENLSQSNHEIGNTPTTEELVSSVELLTTDQTCQFLQICSKTLRKIRKAGEIKFVMVGKRYRYQMKDIMMYLSMNRHSSNIEMLKVSYFKN